MSTSPDGRRDVVVAPRELHDLAYRCARVAGCDPGTATSFACNLVHAEIHDWAGVSELLAALDEGRSAVRTLAADADARRVDGDAVTDSPELRNRACREGLRVEQWAFHELKRAAHAFLVPEAVLDS